MREPLVRHETIEYQQNEPFHIVNATGDNADAMYVKNSHWHEELEIAYVLHGHYFHYIDGECIEAVPGRLIVTNCESVHRIDVNGENSDPEVTYTIVLIVHRRFLEENFPQYKNFWFTNENKHARPEIRDIMLRFSEYRKRTEHAPNEHLYMRGLLLQLLYYLYLEGAVDRSNNMSLKRQEQVQNVKEILQYVENHYREPIMQADVAKNFYFTPQYFARYFKQYTGVTFIEHLTNYRVNQARLDLLNTDDRISDIARNNGFYDDRCFINAFKKIYHITPLQYKKAQSTGMRK